MKQLYESLEKMEHELPRNGANDCAAAAAVYAKECSKLRNELTVMKEAFRLASVRLSVLGNMFAECEQGDPEHFEQYFMTKAQENVK